MPCLPFISRASAGHSRERKTSLDNSSGIRATAASSPGSVVGYPSLQQTTHPSAPSSSTQGYRRTHGTLKWCPFVEPPQGIVVGNPGSGRFPRHLRHAVSRNGSYAKVSERGNPSPTGVHHYDTGSSPGHASPPPATGVTQIQVPDRVTISPPRPPATGRGCDASTSVLLCPHGTAPCSSHLSCRWPGPDRGPWDTLFYFTPRCACSDRASATPRVPFPSQVSHPPDRNETKWDRMGQI